MLSKGSIRNRLMIQFLLIISFFILTDLGGLLLLQRYNRTSIDQFERLNNTVSIAYYLGASHQHLSDYLNNYQDPLFEQRFLESLTELNLYLKELDAQIIQVAREYNDINYYYNFLEVQEMVLTYIEKGRILIARAQNQTKRAVLYDHLYELKEYRTQVFEKSSDLLFRQTLLMRESVEGMSRKLGYITVGVILGTLILAFGMMYLAFRMANKITAPIHNLVLSAENAAKGDFSPQQANVHADTEIQILIDAFNNMMDNTGNLISELEQKAELENLLAKARLETLNAQINPHFLFNTLNAISSLAMIEDAGKTGSMINSLSDILRYYLNFGDDEIRFSEELHLLEQYLQIQETRFGKRLKTKMNVGIGIEKLSIPPMLLQPILENAIKHGLEPKEGPGTVSIDAQISEQNLIVRISDNGIGISPGKQDELKNRDEIGKGHIGIQNVQKRMEILYGPERFTFRSEPGETVFVFNFPLHYYETQAESDSGSS